MIERAIFIKLRNEVAITAIVSDRIGHNVTRQTIALPRIRIKEVSQNPVEHLNGSAGLADSRIQIDCFAAIMDTAIELAEMVRLTLQGFRGQVAQYFIQGINYLRGLDLADDPFDGTDRPIYWKSLDFRVWYTQEKPILI